MIDQIVDYIESCRAQPLAALLWHLLLGLYGLMFAVGLAHL